MKHWHVHVLRNSLIELNSSPAAPAVCGRDVESVAGGCGGNCSFDLGDAAAGLSFAEALDWHVRERGRMRLQV